MTLDINRRCVDGQSPPLLHIGIRLPCKAPFVDIALYMGDIPALAPIYGGDGS